MKRLKKVVFLLILIIQCFCANSQTISHGPVIGGVSSTEFKIYVRSIDAVNVKVEVSESMLFLNPISVTSNIDFQNDSSTIITVSGLQPNTEYYYKVFLDNVHVFNDQISTFPNDGQIGNYVFGVGSCVSHNHPQQIVDVIRMNYPSLFIYTGDWGYPDQLYGNSSNYFPSIPGAIEKSYHDRYSDMYAKSMLSSIPIDYVYDDHDFVKDNCSGQSASSVYFNPNTQQTSLNEYAYPYSLKRNSVNGYNNYFPHYDLPDTSNGIYHSYKMGNAEFFVLDLRYSRTANTACFSQDSTARWFFDPDPSHTILGSAQKQWLTNKLLNSTADWKFIVSPVTYNKSFSQIMNLMIALQDFNFNIITNIKDSNPKKANLLNIWKDEFDIKFGESTIKSGEHAFDSIKKATEALKNNEIDVLVTAPINKASIQEKVSSFIGHTEFLQGNFEGESLMIMASEVMKIAFVTGHVPLIDVKKSITPENISNKAKLLNTSLVQDFGIRKPKGFFYFNQ